MSMHARRAVEPREAKPRESGESFGDLLSQLASNFAALVRDEVALAKREMGDKVLTLRSGLMTVAIGALTLTIALLTLTAAAVIGLAHYMDAGYAALVVGGALAGIVL